jgi:hypothetical protein
MPRYLIELTHDEEHAACVKALRAIEQYGSHFFAHSNWGCKAGVHSGWLIVELDSPDEAMHLVPPEYREDARIVEVNHFTKEEIASLVAELED